VIRSWAPRKLTDLGRFIDGLRQQRPFIVAHRHARQPCRRSPCQPHRRAHAL